MELLIADASPLVRRMIRNALENAGISNIIEAETGQQALALLARKSPGIVMIGSDLDDMSGIDLAVKVRALPQWRHLPMFLVTDKRAPEDVLEAVDCGIDHYILIPFSEEVLVDKVTKAMEQVAQAEQAAAARQVQIQRLYRPRS